MPLDFFKYLRAVMNLEFFIAKRLFGTRNSGKRVSRPAVTIAQWGVAVGISIMTISMCIVVGFKQEIRNKIIGFGGHIHVSNYVTSANGELPVTTTAEDIENISATTGVEHVQKYIQRPGLIATGKEYEGVLLKGIGNDYNASFFLRHLIKGEMPSFSDTVSSSQIVLSHTLAKKLNSDIGDKIDIYFMQDGIKMRRMTLAAIFETHLNELDATLALTDIYTMRRINKWNSNESSGIEIAIQKYKELENTRDKVWSAMNKVATVHDEQLYIQTVEEMNPHMFAWLNVLDGTVWIILVLVLGIAGFTGISGLLILILEKTNFIGILKAIGAKNISVMRIFLYYAMFIIVRGVLWGNAIGITLCLIQQHTHIISLDPEMYYMQHVPIEFTWWLFPMNILMFIISVAMLVLPSLLISYIKPTKAIKFE